MATEIMSIKIRGAKKLQQVNKHKVGRDQWAKWPDLAQRVFNSTFEQVRGWQDGYRHPKGPTVHAEHWETTAWNAAWTAADAVVKGLDDIIAKRGYAK